MKAAVNKMVGRNISLKAILLELKKIKMIKFKNWLN